MEIRNYTSFWNLERKVYSFYDVQLPIPLSLRVLGVFVGTGAPWWTLMFLLGVPFGPPWYLLYVIPPGLLAWLGSKPIFEGKTLVEYLKARLGHLLENKAYKRLEPDLNKYESDLEIEQNVITKEPLKPSPFK
jgi:hypothetical protein